jgi:hypothetical protein
MPIEHAAQVKEIEARVEFWKSLTALVKLIHATFENEYSKRK